jgi:glycosyltransferase involved in cell wall biosynthesis
MAPTRIRLAFVTSHPIQYHAAWFRALANEPALDFEVLYCHRPAPGDQGIGFGVPFTWDVPLLDGYRHRFVRNVARRPALGSFAGLDTPELSTLINRRRYDAVVVNGWHFKSAWQAIRACWKHRLPVLVRSDSHLKTPRHRVKQMAKAIPYRWFIPRFDGCLAVGQWSREYFEHFGANDDRIFLVPHVVDPRFEHESIRLEPTRDMLRRHWNLESRHIVFLFVGKFVEKKRPADFIRSVARAAADNQAIAGVMVGDGALRGACEQLARDVNAPIQFAGFLNQTDIVKAFVMADALVLPSDGGETWGVVVNEAMSCGRPALVSDHVGCAPDLISHARTGFVFRLGDVAELSGHMLSCAAHRWHLKSMGAGARLKIREHSIEQAVRRLSTAVETVLVKAA